MGRPGMNEALFWRRVDKSGDCWRWIGRLRQTGYGTYGRRTGHTRAHRLAYEMLIGPIPNSLELDHLCHNRACVNPAHLEPVTHAENMRRSIWATATHCRRGHLYTGKRQHNGGRMCEECNRDYQREWARRKRGQVAA